MAYPLRGESEAQLAGKSHKLKLDFGDFEELDAATGMGPFEMMHALTPFRARLPLLLAVLQRAVRDPGGKRLPPPQIKVLVSEAGFTEAVEAAGGIVLLCLREPKAKKDDDEGNADAAGEAAETETERATE